MTVATDLRPIWNRDEFKQFAQALGVRPDWHEPDEQDVTATVTSTNLDNAGFPTGSMPDSPDSEEATVTFYKNGKPVGRVLLATLCAFASGWEGLP